MELTSLSARFTETFAKLPSTVKIWIISIAADLHNLWNYLLMKNKMNPKVTATCPTQKMNIHLMILDSSLARSSFVAKMVVLMFIVQTIDKEQRKTVRLEYLCEKNNLSTFFPGA